MEDNNKQSWQQVVVIVTATAHLWRSVWVPRCGCSSRKFVDSSGILPPNWGSRGTKRQAEQRQVYNLALLHIIQHTLLLPEACWKANGNRR